MFVLFIWNVSINNQLLFATCPFSQVDLCLFTVQALWPQCQHFWWQALDISQHLIGMILCLALNMMTLFLSYNPFQEVSLFRKVEMFYKHLIFVTRWKVLILHWNISQGVLVLEYVPSPPKKKLVKMRLPLAACCGRYAYFFWRVGI